MYGKTKTMKLKLFTSGGIKFGLETEGGNLYRYTNYIPIIY